MDDRLIIGAMSGTSADGVDAALVRISGHGLAMSATPLQHCHHPYDQYLRKTIFDIRASGKSDLSTLARLAREISLAYAVAVRDVLVATNVQAGEITAIAAHGQTLFHQPPMTIQWFDPSLLAWETKCAVVSDFRRADCAAGGQGAPLVPFADYILFRHPTKNRVLLNIGGIANITYLRAGGAIDEVIAFDTGPGNCISDWLCRKLHPAGPGYDAGGQIAARGSTCVPLLREMLSHPYFSQRPPKSTDGPAMIQIFEEAAKKFSSLSLEDLLHTACSLTATSIIQSVAKLVGTSEAEMIISGGGSENQTITYMLSQASIRLHPLRIDELGILSSAKEAVAFALLGAATLDGVPSNVPSATGASRTVVLGSITPAP